MKNKENQAGAAEEIEEGCQQASAGRPQEQGEPSSAAEQPAQGSQASGACNEGQGEPSRCCRTSRTRKPSNRSLQLKNKENQAGAAEQPGQASQATGACSEDHCMDEFEDLPNKKKAENRPKAKIGH